MATVGIYEFAVKCLAPIELLLNGLNASIFPRVIKLITSQTGGKTSTPEINRYFYGQVSVIMLAICASIAGLPWVIEWFVNKSNYFQAVRYIPYLSLLFILRAIRLYYIVPNNVLKRMKRLTVLNLIATLTKVGLMIVLITKYQIFGVIMSSAASYLLEIGLMQYYLRRDYAMEFNGFKLFIAPSILALMIAGLEPIFGNEFPTLLHIGYAIVCCGLLWFSYRREIRLLKSLRPF
jgi:O-antigen/teichoic acid export membrane protein